MTIRVEIVVDYVCPYCFLVEDAVAELSRERDVEVDILPFELRPAPVPTLKPEDAYLPRVWNSSVYPMARRVGLDITLPSISPQPRSAKAFIVLQLAKELGLQDRYSRAIFEAFFQQDRDIGADAVIVEVAESVGLAARDVHEALMSPVRQRRHDADQRHVAEIGVTAVPSFRIGGRLYSGVLTADQLITAVDSAAVPTVAG